MKTITFNTSLSPKNGPGIFLMLLMILAMHINAYPQNSAKDKKMRVRMSLEYFNNTDESRVLTATPYYIEDRIRKPLNDELVYFYLGERSDDVLIDSIFTDENGEASLTFEEGSRFALDEDRAFTISAYYNGSKKFTSADADMTIKDISMELMLSEMEGVKTINVRAYELGEGEELVPVKDADVNFYVPRLFSDQFIGEGSFENGKCSIEFPENIAGDTIGNISIIARIEEHDNYGNVERQIKNFRWGTTQPIEEDKSLMTIEITIPTRALWHTNAPLWMIITLIILLTGVWSHYLYVIWQLFRIKKLSKATDGPQAE